MKSKFHISATVLALSCLTACSSGSEPKAADGDDVLVEYGDSTLTLTQVLSKIPSGLSTEDSVKMIGSITEDWIREMLLRDAANENVGMLERIDRQTREYRQRLIMNEYLHLAASAEKNMVSEQLVKEYYATHQDSLMLKEPIIKGVFLKVSSQADRLTDLKRWVRGGSRQSIDQLEKTGLKGAYGYDYFADRWMDWSEIVALIPYRFGDAEAFLKGRSYFEHTYGDMVYLLHIYEYISSGQPMPYAYASSKIREILMHEGREQYVEQLVNNLSNRAIKEGKLKTPAYDLTTHNIKPEAFGNK